MNSLEIGLIVGLCLTSSGWLICYILLQDTVEKLRRSNAYCERIAKDCEEKIDSYERIVKVAIAVSRAKV